MQSPDTSITQIVMLKAPWTISSEMQQHGLENVSYYTMLLPGEILIWHLRYNRFKWGWICDGQFSRDNHRLGNVRV